MFLSPPLQYLLYKMEFILVILLIIMRSSCGSRRCILGRIHFSRNVLLHSMCMSQCRYILGHKLYNQPCLCPSLVCSNTLLRAHTIMIYLYGTKRNTLPKFLRITNRPHSPHAIPQRTLSIKQFSTLRGPFYAGRMESTDIIRHPRRVVTHLH